MTTLVDFSQYYVDLFKTLSGLDVTPDQVFFGDQSAIQGPRTICVEPDRKINTFTAAAAARMLKIEVRTFIFVYCNRVVDQHENRLESDQLAELVEAQIWLRPTCGGLVDRIFVDQVESGYVPKSRTSVVAANRLTVVGTLDRSILPNPVE